MPITAFFVIALFIFGVFQLGRWSLTFKIARLKKENWMLRNLLDKTFRMEELNVQTYSKIISEYTQTDDEL